MVGGIDPTPTRSPTFIDVRDGEDQERRIPIMQLTETKPEAMGIRQTSILMVKQAQQTGDRSVATSTQYSGDDLDIEVIHPSQ